MPKRKGTYAKGRPAKRQRMSGRASAGRKALWARKRQLKRRMVPRKIANPPFFRNLAPRIKTTMVNRISLSMSVSTGAGAVTSNAPIAILPLRLRDPDGKSQGQCYPENFTEMSRLYSRYRVTGVKVFISVHGLTNTEDEKFWLAVYTTTSKDGLVDPYRKSIVVDYEGVNAVLQHPGIRKKMITDSGTTGGRRNNSFNPGFYSISGIEEMRRIDMPDKDYSGAVQEGGGGSDDPAAAPVIWIRAFSPRSQGFAATRTYDVNVTLKFYCEWFDRRESLEPELANQGDEVLGNTPV